MKLWGAEVRAWKPQKDYGCMHCKLILIDGGVGLMGSANHTYAAMNLNRELCMKVTDEGVLSKLDTMFEQVWADEVELIDEKKLL